MTFERHELLHPEIIGVRLDDPAVRAAANDLWHRLEIDPNDIAAFTELVDLMRRRGLARQGDEPGGHVVDDVTWALAEELARSVKAWYPLIQLARLSLSTHHEAGMGRLATAVSRDTTGRALEAAVNVLREAGTPAEAHAFGIGHWRSAEHAPATGRAIVLAALEADRPAEAHSAWQALQQHPDTHAVAAIVAELAVPLRKALDAGPRTGSLSLAPVPRRPDPEAGDRVVDMRADGLSSLAWGDRPAGR